MVLLGPSCAPFRHPTSPGTRNSGGDLPGRNFAWLVCKRTGLRVLHDLQNTSNRAAPCFVHIIKKGLTARGGLGDFLSLAFIVAGLFVVNKILKGESSPLLTKVHQPGFFFFFAFREVWRYLAWLTTGKHGIPQGQPGFQV